MQLVPAVRERMLRIRFLTAMAVGSLVIEDLEGDPRHRDATPYLVWEWLVVEALTREMRDDPSIRGVPGTGVTRAALAQHKYVDARSYLKTPRVFGFHGVYKRLAVHLGLLDVHLAPGPNAERLADAWARGQGLGGLAGARQLMERWKTAVRRSLDQTPPRTRANWNASGCLARFLEIESEPDREDLAFFARAREPSRERLCRRAGRPHEGRRGALAPVGRAAGARSSRKAARQAEPSRLESPHPDHRGVREPHRARLPNEPRVCRNRRSLTGRSGRGSADAGDHFPPWPARPGGAQDDTPVVQRASAYLSQAERQAESWKRPQGKSAVRRQLVCTLPVIGSGTDARSSLNEAVAFCRQRGGSPHEARVASPFFDVDDGSGRVAAALCKSMARGRTREIRFCLPASRDDGEIAVPRLAAPKAIATTPLEYRGHVTVSTLPALDGDENLRPWHAKMLALRGDSYTGLMIGSSNFTCAGMGTAPYRNAEANLVTVVERVAYGREAGRLETVWSQMGPNVDPDAAEWLGPQPEFDEDDGAVAPPVPAGFVSATYRAGDERTILLRLDPGHLPSEWRIHACGREAREILTRSAWAETDSRAVVTVHWSPVQPPDRLLVSWDGQEAFLPLNVEDAHQLPPPARLERMSADDMLWILAAADPSAAFRAWARAQQPSASFDADLDSATPIDLDPLRRHDLQATFLHRIRRRARILAQLRANLQRPVWGRQALEWRLRGMIGVQALADRLVREIAGAANMADEALLTLADFLIVLREVDYAPSAGCLSKAEFDAEFQPFPRRARRQSPEADRRPAIECIAGTHGILAAGPRPMRLPDSLRALQTN